MEDVLSDFSLFKFFLFFQILFTPHASFPYLSLFFSISPVLTKEKNSWLTRIHRVLYFTWHGRNFRRLVCRSKSRKHVDQPESRISFIFHDFFFLDVSFACLVLSPPFSPFLVTFIRRKKFAIGQNTSCIIFYVARPKLSASCSPSFHLLLCVSRGKMAPRSV